MSSWAIALIVIGAIFVLALVIVPIVIAVSVASQADRTRKNVERKLRLRK